MARPRSTCAPGVARKGLPDQAKISHVIPGVPPAGLDRAVARGRVGDRDLDSTISTSARVFWQSPFASRQSPKWVRLYQRRSPRGPRAALQVVNSLGSPVPAVVGA